MRGQSRLFQNDVFLIVVSLSASVAFRIRGTEPSKESLSGNPTLHVIGDTHGDANFLVRSLLSTELFSLGLSAHPKLKSFSIKWREDLPSTADFLVVVLGDVIDRGKLSYENLQLLRSLQKSTAWGSRLKVLLGNHEGMLLEYDMKYANKTHAEAVQGWTKERRHEALMATSGEDYDLMSWLENLPVVHLWHGVLLMHGGLHSGMLQEILGKLEVTPTLESQDGNNGSIRGHLASAARFGGRHLWKLASMTGVAEITPFSGSSAQRACQTPGTTCGEWIVNHMNNRARSYYTTLHDCILNPAEYDIDTSGSEWPGHRCVFKVGEVEFLNLLDGILWYRGLSSISSGAGTPEKCNDAEVVARTLGAKAMVLAHVTHPFITELCGRNVPIYLVDTHNEDCLENNECDFAFEKVYHDGEIQQGRRTAPQSLRIEHVDGEFYAQACLSKVVGTSVDEYESSVQCFDPLAVIEEMVNEKPVDPKKEIIDIQALFSETMSESMRWVYKGRSFKCCTSSVGKATHLQDMNAESLPNARTFGKRTGCGRMFGDTYHNGLNQYDGAKPSCPVRAQLLLEITGDDYWRIRNKLPPPLN